jgi:hypothetical protein
MWIRVSRSPALMVAGFLAMVGLGIGTMLQFGSWGNSVADPWWLVVQWACGGAAVTLTVADAIRSAGSLHRGHWAVGLLAAAVFVAQALVYAALFLLLMALLIGIVSGG